jgi:hypothetical protein
MARWLVELTGDRFDLEEYPRWYPDGDIHALEEDRKFFLTGNALDRLGEANAVRDEAVKTLDQFAAIISLFEPNIRKPVVSAVIQEDDAGGRNVFLWAEETARAKMRAVLTTDDQNPTTSQAPTQAQSLLSRALQNPRLLAALEVWGAPGRSWPQLYRILEEVEGYLGKRVDKAGLCSRGERGRFTHTADTAEVAGKNSRHALGLFKPPSSPITLAEAAAFVGRLLLVVLQGTP